MQFAFFHETRWKEGVLGQQPSLHRWTQSRTSEKVVDFCSVCPHGLLLQSNCVHDFTSRFRMRQVNVVGASPFSQSSRVIQTLQAPPDVAPTSITVRTASETSLRLRWVVSWGPEVGCRDSRLEYPGSACEARA